MQMRYDSNVNFPQTKSQQYTLLKTHSRLLYFEIKLFVVQFKLLIFKSFYNEAVIVAIAAFDNILKFIIYIMQGKYSYLMLAIMFLSLSIFNEF